MYLIMKNKKNINEGLFSATKKFTDAFFDGLKNNTANKVLSKARKARVKDDAIRKMEQMIKDKVELEKILNGDY